jgi:alpha-tubulin suppressor-like RCC1 family protein
METKPLLIASFIFTLTASAFALEQGTMIGWGSNTEVVEPHDYFGQATPPDGNDFIAIAAGLYHSIALRTDGGIQAWGPDGIGDDGYYDFGQVTNTPVDLDFIAIAAGDYHNVAIRTDHSLESWGDDYYDQVADTPSGNDFIAIAGGLGHSLALRSNGTVVVWGDDYYGQITDAPTSGHFIAIACGADHCLAIADAEGAGQGSLVAWGRNTYGQTTVPAGNDFIAIDAGYNHSLGLRADGSVVAWGRDDGNPLGDFGQVTNAPAGHNFIAIAAGRYHNIAMKSDYSLVSWGRDTENEVAETPAGTNYLAIAGGGYHSLAMELNCQYTLRGDWNHDCGINLSDYHMLASAWLSGYTLSDLQNMMEHWLINCRSTPNDPACVPLP